MKATELINKFKQILTLSTEEVIDEATTVEETVELNEEVAPEVDNVEVNESEWKRLKESQTKQGDVLIPTFVSEGEGMGDIKDISKSNEEVSGDDEWYGADEQVEEEE